ncbi:hypothetical protein [Breoghania sp.]|uniref:hypothetical protein n=1 Tax=Breoghania sp. TaxID=2065378 RepID=UPI002AAC218D|nr:hypothetical protein [Breoghania sp.]
MSARSDSQGDPTDGCGHEAVREELGRVLASPGFAASPQLRAFLSYVVEHRLQGIGARIKGYTIAVEALGRDPSFDPTADPIVRVEAARLRRLLDDYYVSDGAANPIRIDLPKGGYVPRFAHRGTVQTAPASPSSQDATRERGDRTRWARRRLAYGLGAVLSVFAITLYFFASQPDPQPTSPLLSTDIDESGVTDPAIAGFKGHLPVIHVATISQDAATHLPPGYSGAALRDKLTGALSRFDEIETGRTPEEADYRLEGQIAADGKRLLLNFRLVYQANNEVVWSSLFETSVADESPDLVQERVARNAATAIAQPYGVVFNHVASQAPLQARSEEGGQTENAQGLACVLRTFSAQRRFSPDTNARSRACLASLAAHAQAPAAVHALLPLAYIDNVRSGADPARRAEDLQTALKLAERAVALSPKSARAYQALESVLIYLGRNEEALDAGRRALSLNPDDPDILAAHGSALVMSGEAEGGLELLVRAARLSPDHPDWYATMTVFAALAARKSDLAEAEAKTLARSTRPTSYLARLLVAHERGDRPAARALLGDLRAANPIFLSDPQAALHSAVPSPLLRTRLLEAVSQADGISR